MKTILFKAIPDSEGNRDGGNGWEVSLDEKFVYNVDNDHMDIGDSDMVLLLMRAGVDVVFDYD